MIVRLELHDGNKYEATIEGFVLSDFIERINTQTNRMIEFGNYGIMAHAIKLIDANGTTTTV